MTKEEYVSIIKMLKEVANLLRDPKRLPNPDLLDVDYFLYYALTVAEDVEGDTAEEMLDHDEVVNMLMSIGKGLGFDVLREVPLIAGTRVDVVFSRPCCPQGCSSCK